MGRGLKRGLTTACVGLAIAGCGRERAESRAQVPQPVTLPIEVLADTGRAWEADYIPGTVLGARAWLARVSDSPPVSPGAAVPKPAAIEVPLPDAAPDTLLPDWPSPPALEIPAGLEPPILRSAAPLRIPRGRHANASVELEMRVDERGEVSDVRWAGGSSDPALVEAAIECARSMRFIPARRGGEPVAVWCGQRFDFGGR